MKDYRVTIKVRNNRLLKAIEDAGGTPGPKWCEANGLGYIRVNNLINMTSGPLTANGDLCHDAERLCDVLGKLPEDLWSNEQLHPLERNFSEMEMDYAQVVAMLPDEQQFYLPDFSEIEQTQTKDLFNLALSTLTPREEKLIRMRFYDDLNRNECAEILEVTPQRIRMIEEKALRKLRFPERVGIIVDTLDIEEASRKKLKQKAAEFLERFDGDYLRHRIESTNAENEK